MPAPAPSSPTADERAAAIAALCKQATQTATGWQCCCPAHDDTTPSLSISTSDDRVLLHCHAGCTIQDICGILMIDIADLFGGTRARRNQNRDPIEATYDYVDATGTLRFQSVRFASKKFRQRQPDPAKPNAWIWNLKGVPPILYRLPEVEAAMRQGRAIYIVEGEKDADNLWALGLAATCNPMGAGKWRASYSETLRGADCRILPDHDEPGAKHAQQVARMLSGIAAFVRIVPGIHTKSAGSDVSDWLQAGHSSRELEDLARQTPLWVQARTAGPMTVVAGSGTAASTDVASNTPPVSFDVDRLYTDTYNARALIKAHKNDMRYCFDWKCWLVWSGTHWLKDTSGQMMRWAKTAVKDLARLSHAMDNDQTKALLTHIKSSLSTAKLKAMIESAQSEEGMQSTPADFDTNHWLLTCLNGTIDLRLGTLRPASRADFITKSIPITYASEATCPTWRAFLERIMHHDSALVDFLQRAIGYSLTGDTREQCLFMLYGTGANGKSTFLDVVQSLLGVYAQSTPASTLLAKHGLDAVSNDIARLHGARFLSVTEISEGKRLNEALIKKLTGNDVLTGRFLYAEFFDFKGAFKIWIACNHKPMLEGTDYAMKRRIKVVPLEVTFREDAEGELRQDKTLPEKLQAELPGILIWAIEGCLAWQGSKGLDIPEKVKEESAEYFNSMDTVGRFIQDMCVEPPDVPPSVKASSALLYKTYQQWCTANGEEEKPLKAFGAALTEHGCIRKHEMYGWFWHRIGLRQAPKDDKK